MRASSRTPLLSLELLTVLGFVVATWMGAQAAVDQVLDQVAGLARVAVRTPEDVRAAAVSSLWLWTGAVGLLVAARLWSLRRSGLHLPAPVVLPAVVGLTGLGLTLQLGYGDPLRPEVWTAPRFATGIAIGAALVALALLPRWPVDRLLADRRLRVGAGVAAVLVVLALRFGPMVDHEMVRKTRQYVNLKLTASKAVQPLELVKLVFAVLVALSLAGQARKLQTHRLRLGPVAIPRLTLLVGAVGLLLLLLGGIFFLGDLGMSVVVALLWVGLLHAAIGDRRWALAGLGVIAAAVAAVCVRPELVGGFASERVRMWLDPWTNGLARGMQTAQALWAIALGGLWGRGLGHADPGALPEGHTDLVLAHLAEELGLVGGVAYLLLLGGLALQALWIGARARTLERGMVAVASGGLLLAQLFVIFGGTVGWIPLTGIVVPFLSRGMSSGAVFVLVACLPLVMAEDGAPRGRRDRGLLGLQRSATDLAVVAGGVLVAAAAQLGWTGVAQGEEILGRPVVVTVGSGEDAVVVLRHARALERLADELDRGAVLAREGEVIRGVDDGAPTWPLGPILGTRLGLPSDMDGRIVRPWWQLERQYEDRLSGLPALPAWNALLDEDGDVLAVARTETELAAARAAFGEDREEVPLTHRDLSALVPIARIRPAARAAAVAAWNADTTRTVHTSIHAGLQSAAHDACASVERGTGCAVAVIDVDSGQILALAQGPDIDPAEVMAGGPAAVVALDAAAATDRTSPWLDKAGSRAGVVALGSPGKLFSAIAWLRTHDPVITGTGADRRGGGPWQCTWDDGRLAFGLDDWRAPIHSYGHHGLSTGDLVAMLRDSSNCMAAQVGIDAGRQALRDLACAGVGIGHVDDCEEFDPGPEASRRLGLTAIGQGAMEMDVLQAARLVAAVSDGRYRDCPDVVGPADGGPPCTEQALLDDPDEVGLLLTGLYQVGARGTARKALKRHPLPGVRVYAKTGTADAPAAADEGEVPTCGHGPCPHSWFTLLAEPEGAPIAEPGTPGRLAVAAVVFRGGLGSGAAADVALDVTAAAADLGLLAPRTVGVR